MSTYVKMSIVGSCISMAFISATGVRVPSFFFMFIVGGLYFMNKRE